MESSTACNEKLTENYGISITPSTPIQAVEADFRAHVSAVLVLNPGVRYSMPRARERTEFIPAESEGVRTAAETWERSAAIEDDSRHWLRIAESAFKFWDNEADEIWNDV